jgi:hypothetical protein
MAIEKPFGFQAPIYGDQKTFSQHALMATETLWQSKTFRSPRPYGDQKPFGCHNSFPSPTPLGPPPFFFSTFPLDGD